MTSGSVVITSLAKRVDQSVWNSPKNRVMPAEGVHIFVNAHLEFQQRQPYFGQRLPNIGQRPYNFGQALPYFGQRAYNLGQALP